MRVCIVGASGKLGRYRVEHCLERGHEVVGVCREKSVPKLDPWKERIAIVTGRTNDPAVIARAADGCEGVLTVLASNITRRIDFALFMVEALENDELVHEAPAIVSRASASALEPAS